MPDYQERAKATDTEREQVPVGPTWKLTPADASLEEAEEGHAFYSTGIHPAQREHSHLENTKHMATCTRTSLQRVRTCPCSRRSAASSKT